MVTPASYCKQPKLDNSRFMPKFTSSFISSILSHSSDPNSNAQREKYHEHKRDDAEQRHSYDGEYHEWLQSIIVATIYMNK